MISATHASEGGPRHVTFDPLTKDSRLLIENHSKLVNPVGKARVDTIPVDVNKNSVSPPLFGQGGGERNTVKREPNGDVYSPKLNGLHDRTDCVKESEKRGRKYNPGVDEAINLIQSSVNRGLSHERLPEPRPLPPPPPRNSPSYSRELPMNGSDRERGQSGTSTTSGNNLTWLSDVEVSSQSHRVHPHETPPSLLPGSPNVFPPTITGEYGSRLYPPYLTTQAPTLPINHTPSLSPYYPPQSQNFNLNPYSSLYSSHLSSHYPPSPLLSRPSYPLLDSYTPVLAASMGSQVQAQSGLPRAFLPGHLPHSLPHTTHNSVHGSSHYAPPRSLSTLLTTSYHHQRAISTSQESSRSTMSGERHSHSPVSSPRTPSSASSPHKRKSPMVTSPVKPGQSVLKEKWPLSGMEPPQEIPRDFKVPCGKEGSLKHRILTRPPDLDLSPTAANVTADLVEVQLEEWENALSQNSKKKPMHSNSSQSVSSPYVTKPNPTSPWQIPSPLVSSAQAEANVMGPPSHSGQPPSGSSSTGVPPVKSVSSAASSPNTTQHSQLHYPPHFTKGSVIHLANGELRRVEDLKTEDFVRSADLSPEVRIDHSTVVRIEGNPVAGTTLLSFSVGQHKFQVTVEAALEHPFFVFGQGWSSCSPDRTQARYNLPCQKLQVGDVCISLTHREPGSQLDHPRTGVPLKDKNSRVGEEREEWTCGDKRPTHSTETQTVTVAASGVVMTLTTLGTTGGNPVTQSRGAGPSRKRRWSAPDQISEEPAKTKQKL